MNCRQFSELVPLCIYGELEDKLRRSLEAHAASCPACRAAQASAAAAVAFLRGNQPRFSPEEVAALRVRVLAETARAGPAPRPYPALGFLASLFASPILRFASVAAAAALAVWLVIQRAPEEAPEAAVASVLAMADDIEQESEEVAEVCREIDDLASGIGSGRDDSGASLSRSGATA